MKRNDELIEKVSAIAADNKDVAELVRAYKAATYGDWDDRHEFYADMVERMTNDCGFKWKQLAKKMAGTHPTIQQSFMRFVYAFIQNMAEKPWSDPRNENAVEFAKVVKDKVGPAYFPTI